MQHQLLYSLERKARHQRFPCYTNTAKGKQGTFLPSPAHLWQSPSAWMVSGAAHRLHHEITISHVCA